MMHKGVKLFVIIFTVLFLSTTFVAALSFSDFFKHIFTGKVIDSDPSTSSIDQYYQQDADGLVSMEAELADFSTTALGYQWDKATGSTYSNSLGMKSLPNNGTVLNSNNNSPQLEYRVNFVKTGIHYVWIRGVGASLTDDSVNAGIDKEMSGNGWNSSAITGFGTKPVWSKTINSTRVAIINVTTTGTHIFSLWMREDGFIVDKIVLTTNSSYVPSALGPRQSDRITPVCEPTWQCGEWSLCINGTRQRTCSDINNCGVGNSPATEESCAVNGYQQDSITGNLVMEAEINDGTTANSNHSWDKISKSTFSEGTGLQSNPNNGANLNSISLSPQINYNINFIKNGTYYVWIRGVGASLTDDSVYVGLNGNIANNNSVITGFSTNPLWKGDFSNGKATITVNNLGSNVFNLWMREDGFIVDKIVLTTNSSYVPSGMGPNKSARVDNPQPPISCTDSDGGLEYNIPGKAEDSIRTLIDTCNGNILNEAVCVSNGSSYVQYTCSDGLTCLSGFCANVTLSIATLKDQYRINEQINLTDPPDKLPQTSQNFNSQSIQNSNNNYAPLKTKDNETATSYIIEFKEPTVVEKQEEVKKMASENKRKLDAMSPLNPAKYLLSGATKPEDVPKKVEEYKTKLRKSNRDKKDKILSHIKSKQNGRVASTGNVILQNNKETILSKILKFTGRVTDEPTSEESSDEFINTFNGITVEATKDEIELIKNLPEVKSVYPNKKVQADLMDSIPIINADDTWRIKDAQGLNLTGKNMTIAIIDTGVDYTHPDLGNGVRVFPIFLTRIYNNPINKSVISDSLDLYNNETLFVAGKEVYLYNSSKGTNKISKNTSYEYYNSFLYNGTYVSVVKNKQNGMFAIIAFDVKTGKENIILPFINRYFDISIQRTENYLNFDVVYDFTDGLNITSSSRIIDRLYVYNFNNKQLINVKTATNDFFSPAVVNNNKVYFSQGSTYLNYIHVYDLTTGQYLPDVYFDNPGFISDSYGDNIVLNTIFSGPNDYAIYNTKTGNQQNFSLWSMPLDVSSTSKWVNNRINSSGVSSYNDYQPYSMAKINDKLAVFEISPIAKKFSVYDRINNKIVSFANLSISFNDIDLDGNKICLYSYDGVFCFLFNSSIKYNVSDSPRFNSKVIGGYDFVGDDNDPMDDQGHGTHTASTAAGNGVLKGIAPDAKILAYKVLGYNGGGFTSDIIGAIDRAVDPNNDGNFADHATVISMSLGGEGTPDDPLSRAADKAVESGSIVVVSAGNAGPGQNSVGSPGTARKVITVGATYKTNYNSFNYSCFPGVRTSCGICGSNGQVTCNYFGDSPTNTDQVTAFSSRGPVAWYNEDYSFASISKPDVLAPGAFICAAKYGGIYSDGESPYYTPCLDDRHVQLAGTSMSAPIVAGSAALIKQAHPSWTPEDVKYSLRNTAAYVGNDPYTFGAGRIDVLKAVQLNAPIIGKLGDGGTVPRIINITGTAKGTNFNRYELSYGEGLSPNNWYTITIGNNPIDNGTLANNFDTNMINAEQATIRLSVYDNNGLVSNDYMIISPTYHSGTISGDPLQFNGQPIASPSMEDVNNDGMIDTILGLAGGELYDLSYDNVSGVMKYWKVTLTPGIYASPVITDLDGDGRKEILVRGLGSLTILNNQGSIIKKTSINDDYFVQEITVGDMDNDGKKEIVFSTTSKLWVLDSNGNVKSGWPINTFNSYGYDYIVSPSLMDVNNDGKLDIIGAFRSSAEINAYNLNGQAIPGWNRTYAVDSGSGYSHNLIIDDLDGDGSKEIVLTIGDMVFGGSSAQLLVLDSNGNVKAGWPKTYSKDFYSISVADMDNDGKKEIVAVNGDDINIVKLNGDIYPGFPRTALGGLNAFAIGDVDGDGRKEIFGGEVRGITDEVFMMDDQGNEVWRAETLGRMSQAIIGDVDGDGEGEVLFTTMGGDGITRLFMFNKDGSKVNYVGSVRNNNSSWPTYHYNEARTNCYNCDSKPVSVKPQSKLANDAAYEINGSLNLSIEKYDSNRTLWIFNKTIVSGQFSIGPGNLVKLDNLWNRKNVIINVNGTYRVKASFSQSNNSLNATWQFNVA